MEPDSNKNKNTFNGLSVLPYSNGSYQQAPFEEITKEEYEELKQKVLIVYI